MWLRLRLLDSALAALLLAILMDQVLDWTNYAQEKAEKVVVEQTINALKRGLKQRMGDMMMHAQAHRWDRLVEENPFNWLDKQPENYCGELDKLAAGCWVYDAARHEIIYQVNRGEHFHSSGTDSTIRFKLVAIYPDQRAASPAASVELQLLQAYRWFDEE